ncbi:hypothetical protein [Pararhizobium sp. IMCC21322]|uniref:hypothetical protein n=1 Tax=Pararhizobium sp. IMCC21322 TaxID=3067903 RepID=UPI0027423C0E|nr:hypothetical protein [Pararhizobium sp. IMCC21322]
MLRRNFFLTTTALFGSCILSSAAFSADLYVTGEPVLPTVLPAVSGLNGKISLKGGALDEEGFGALQGSVSLPLGQRFGLQLDGSVGILDEEFTGGVGGHLFWRDPSYALLGIYGSYTTVEAVDGDIARLGVEGEYYWNQFTVKSVIGAEFIDIDAPVNYNETNLFAFSDLSYYATDNLELSVGHRYTGEKHALALGVEYQLNQQVFASGVSLFAEGRIGEDDYQGAWAGVRMYLGDDKSLIRRHREDDPTEWEEDNLFGVINAAGSGKSVCVPDPDLLGPDEDREGYNTCTMEDIDYNPI